MTPDETPDEIRHPGAPERTPSTRSRKTETEAPTVAAEDARQGEIILRTRRRRIVFISGLVGFVVLVLVMRILA